MHSAPVLIDPAPEPTVSEALVDLLLRLGVRSAYGILGGAIAPFGDALGRSSLRFYAMRHEGGAAFAATEASLAAGRPTACVTTTGPGLTNALTGALAVRSEGAHVIVISACTAPRQRGRFAVQETNEHGLLATSALRDMFDLAMTLEVPEQLTDLAVRLSAGLSRVQGFAAHVSLPLSLQHARFTTEVVPGLQMRPNHHPAPEDLEAVVAALAEPFVIWAGFGARHASAEVRELAERTGAHVMVTPRAKGVFPEGHPLFLGVTGIGGHGLDTLLRGRPPARALVLGTRLGEFSSTWEPRLVPSGGLIHVDVDPRVFGASYPTVPTLPVLADVRRLLQAVIPRVASTGGGNPKAPRPAPLAARRGSLVRPQALMQAVQRVVVDGSEAIVFAEPGNSFAWANHLLRFPSPRYRLSGYWASMGHMVTGAVGAALETGRSCVVITGDGSMLMQSELSAAAQYGAPVVWIVLNDARYGMTEAGMQAQGFTPPETRFPRCDFAALARSVGADGVVVHDEASLPDALRRALAARGPFVVDVHVDPAERAPFLGRVKSLAAMGAR